MSRTKVKRNTFLRKTRNAILKLIRSLSSARQQSFYPFPWVLPITGSGSFQTFFIFITKFDPINISVRQSGNIFCFNFVSEKKSEAQRNFVPYLKGEEISVVQTSPIVNLSLFSIFLFNLLHPLPTHSLFPTSSWGKRREKGLVRNKNEKVEGGFMFRYVTLKCFFFKYKRLCY